MLLDYELNRYQASPMVKMDILINGEVVDALSVIVHKEFAARRGRALVKNPQSHPAATFPDSYPGCYRQ